VSDVHVYYVGAGIEIVAKHLAEDLRPAEHVTAPLREKLQECVLARRQRDVSPVDYSAQLVLPQGQIAK
jgi:hypothetical protein